MFGRVTGPFLITVSPDDTFRKLLELITEHWVHRVYVVEAGASRHELGFWDILGRTSNKCGAEQGMSVSTRYPSVWAYTRALFGAT